MEALYHSKLSNRTVIIGLLSVFFATVFLCPKIVQADDGEFWDAAVSTLLRTRRVDKSMFKLKAGVGAVADTDTPTHSAAAQHILGQGTFYGVKADRFARWFSLYGSVTVGHHDDGSTWQLDGFRGRLTVYNYLRTGGISIGMVSVHRDKGVNEKLALKVRTFEYAAGGAMKAVVISLTSSALGYEFQQHYSRDGRLPPHEVTQEDGTVKNVVSFYQPRDDYNGLLIFELAMRIGVVLGKNSRVSVEGSFETDVEFSWPLQKDVRTIFEITTMLNSRVLPLELSILAGHRYSVNDQDGDDGDEYHDSYFYTSAMLGFRY